MRSRDGSVQSKTYRSFAQRLLRVQIENAPAVEVVERYDSKETLFYCDPPYVHGSRGDVKAYKYEMTDGAHRELAATLHKAKVVCPHLVVQS